MSKTPARKAPPQKPAASKPTPAKKAAAKSAPAAKPVAKKTAAAKPKPAPAAKSAAPKAAPAPKKPVKPATVAKPAAAAKPVPPPMKSAPPPAPVPAPPALPPGSPAPVVLRKPGRGASKYAAPAVQAPLPPPTSRFADRFAPPRPPTRQMNNLELDTPRHAQKADPKLANAWKTKTGRELTEPEVLAMPEAEYMNDKQLEFFRFKLQTLKDDLLSNAGETTEHLREDTSIVPDPADRATIEEEHALELRTRDRERKLLKKISQSLARLDSGEYGFCDETGEPIGLGRLIARPTATLSLEAQQRRELKQKMFGD
ncbi:RNA polymerase-binding protein DksA [Polaromonas sp.]|uniref:RNA polymerase-binding protein DksA n=1 Tax=Polaromonas sp. TaxID=1869339 RepID=UPI0027329002|nr:RNA polymerase-binding protein DksA [Polaromonas sp.]MDP3754100.1 RNA polymerase-binding protein DksA [Polaromonas sp.]